MILKLIPYQMTELKAHIRDYLERIAEYKRSDKHWTCPGCGSGTHDSAESTAALTLYEDTNSFFCHSCRRGGSIIDLYMMAHNLPPDDKNSVSEAITELCKLYNITPQEAPQGEPHKREHVYYNADGSIFAKKVIIKKPDGKKLPTWYRYEDGKYLKSLNKAEAPLYMLDKLTKCKSEVIFVAEGEKDVETLVNMGLPATTKPNGARSRWLDQYTEPLRGKRVVILTDNDQDGEAAGKIAAEGLYEAAEKVAIIPATAILANCPHKGDISDIVDKMGLEAAKKALFKAIEKAEPYKPLTDEEAVADAMSGFKSAFEYQTEPVTWLWKGRIPIGYISFLMSPGGCGKSFLSAAIAAAVSKGRALPDGQQTEPGNVLYISAEDSGAIVRERLESCEADLKRIIIQDIDAEKPLLFPEQVEDSESMNRWHTVLNTVKPSLVVVDVWHALTNPETDLNRQNSVRAVLRAVARLAKSHECAFLLLAHTSKRRQETNLNDALLGSSDSVNAARSVLMVVTDSDSGEKALIHTKSNLSELAPSLEFQIDSEGLTFGGFSKITKAVCEEAARKRCTPWELIALKEKHREDDSELLQTLAELAQIGKTVAITYDEVEEAGGSMIWGGSQPKKALERLRKPDLLSRGISIGEIGKRIKRHDKTVRGFMLSCNTTSEEIAGALPK